MDVYKAAVTQTSEHKVRLCVGEIVSEKIVLTT